MGSQIKIAWSKSRIGDLEFFRIRGEHEAGRERRGGLITMELEGRRLQEKEKRRKGKESERGWSHLISQRRQVIIAHAFSGALSTRGRPLFCFVVYTLVVSFCFERDKYQINIGMIDGDVERVLSHSAFVLDPQPFILTSHFAPPQSFLYDTIYHVPSSLGFSPHCLRCIPFRP